MHLVVILYLGLDRACDLYVLICGMVFFLLHSGLDAWIQKNERLIFVIYVVVE